jgi:acetyltransferase-like isoleucine patch superfamily enzyme
MIDTTVSPAKLWGHRKTAYITALIGSIPMIVGKKLRQFIYPSLFKKFGRNVDIEPGVQFICSQAMQIGTTSSVCSYTLINCWHGGEFIVGDFCRIDRGVHVQTIGATIELGERVYLGPYVCMAGPGNITIGRDTMIASHTSIYANNHGFSDPNVPIALQEVSAKGIEIGEDCWIGSGVRILDGVTIGRGSVIGAGAVVTKSIPAYSIAVGVPAKVIGRRDGNMTKPEALAQTLA